MLVYGKNWPKLRTFSPWGPYSGLVIHNSLVYKFLWVLKKSNGVGLQFYQKMPVCGKNWRKLYISWSWNPYSRSVIHNGHLYKFWWIWLKIQRWQFYQKDLFTMKTGRKSILHPHEAHILSWLDISELYINF
jgi:hypothetical protein